jgi:hypothetical protein
MIDPRRKYDLEKPQKISRGRNKKSEKVLARANRLNRGAFSASALLDARPELFSIPVHAAFFPTLQPAPNGV